MDEALAAQPRRSRIFVAVAMGLLLFAMLLLWTQRKPITRDIVDRELSKRGVPARYEITQLGFTTQRLENLSIGDPAAPDLTARVAEVRLRYSGSGVKVSSITAQGVRLRGRLVDGKVRFGEIDKLLPAPTGAPFVLPDVVVDLSDARIRLDTPFGNLGFAISGRGNLADGFTGNVAAISHTIDAAGCRLVRPTAFLNLTISDARPAIDGPVRAQRAACGGAALLRPRAAIDVDLSAALDRWKGNARLAAGPTVAAGTRLAGLSGRLSFDGSASGTSGAFDFAGDRLRRGGISASRVRADGRYATASVYPQLSLRADTRLEGAVVAPATLRPLVAAARAAEGTPIAPIGRSLAAALARAGSSGEVRASLALVQGSRGGALRLADVDASSRSGARATLSGGSGLAYYWPLGATRVDGRIALGGGGLPEMRGRISQASAVTPMRGELRIEPMAAGNARLALAPLRFGPGGGATRVTTTMQVDGPLVDGRVDGLTLPVQASLGAFGAFAINPVCAPLSFDRLRIAGFDFRGGRLPLCPSGNALLFRRAHGPIQGGARIAAPRLAGTIGGTPATLAAQAIAFDVSRADFAGQSVAVRMGTPAALTRLDIDRLTGDIVQGGVRGGFAGLSGKIASVPLLISESAGKWQLLGGILALEGGLRVADEAADPRFAPLLSRDFRLRLARNIISGTGSLRAPESSVHVTDVTLAHDLNTGRGSAQLAVPGISFGEALQPEALTRLTLGVVANVSGTMRGAGEIRWSREGVTSDGSFRTDGMDFAAAFGPLKGLKGEIRFTDLLGLTSAPEQQVTVAEINPGIAVSNGAIRYRLLPGQKVEVLEGRWPFSGGALVLERTALDFGQPSTRTLTFRVEGLDAAQFIQQFEFKNIAATGTFDGTIPMIFDERGGRIVNGRLVVRPGGGTLAYVGEVSNADLGMFAKMAFDALKSIRYDNLAIELDGALDGEIVSRIVFNGINEAPLDGSASKGMLKELTGLPFKFNIVIKAPFRGLLNSAQSLTDPRGLINQSLEKPVELPGSAPPVQRK